MQRQLLKKLSFRPPNGVTQFNQRREMHSRNKKAMELIAKGWSALKEVDRVIDYCELNDRRLIPQLRAAKENFELALEADNSNTHARFWLSKLHLKYHVPGACRAIGAALLIEAANMGDPDAQYELGCKLRVENEYVQSDQQAFHYLEKAVDQLHPGALYLLGAVYLTGECVKKDIASALWCLHRASDKGHAGAAISFGSLVLRGVEIPESVTKLTSKRGSLARTARKNGESLVTDPVEMARERFQIAAKGGCDLGLKWLERLEEEEKQLLTGSEMDEQTRRKRSLSHIHSFFLFDVHFGNCHNKKHKFSECSKFIQPYSLITKESELILHREKCFHQTCIWLGAAPRQIAAYP